MKLVDTRELAREAQRKVAHGGDPVVEKRAALDVLTFADEQVDGRTLRRKSATKICIRAGARSPLRSPSQSAP